MPPSRTIAVYFSALFVEPSDVSSSTVSRLLGLSVSKSINWHELHSMLMLGSNQINTKKRGLRLTHSDQLLLMLIMSSISTNFLD